MSKECKRCGSTKTLNLFYKKKGGKLGREANCKECEKIIRLSQKKRITEYKKKYYQENKEKLDLKNKEWKNNNEVKYKKQQREYRKEWIKKDGNKELIKKLNREKIKERRKTDPIFKAKVNVKCLINQSYKANKIKKESKTADILGCSWEEFEAHLNNNPYGFYVGQEDIDLDHIIPISKADTEKKIIELNHYTNFQLLPSFYNRHIKKNKEYNKKDFEDYLNTEI